ncbi:MAG TPA: helix-hairpin-helix domain-containing protein, partial [Armatimonadota bacterium]|nr:helix-hairpin-helix domain-containing protein [Armatimonadota bacterium]
ATENAVNGLNALESTEAEHARIGRQTLWELAETLSLEEGPARIECYDISNIQGHMATGSMVVAVDGWPASSAYRRFRIKQGEGEPNDYAMMREVMSRRFAAAEAENEKFLPLPNLIVVDGGKGQLNVALDVLAESGHTDIAVVGLAKEHEHVYVPGRSDPVPMAECVRGHRLLMRIRDEAHRFAITHHREIRAKRARKSVLDEAPGIGPKRKRELVKTFRSVARLREATVDEIGKVRGMSRRSAEALKQYLEETMSDRPSK